MTTSIDYTNWTNVLCAHLSISERLMVFNSRNSLVPFNFREEKDKFLNCMSADPYPINIETELSDIPF